MTREKLKSMFDVLRNDPHHHLGLGDIRLTVAQQDLILDTMTGIPPAEGAEEITAQKYLSDNGYGSGFNYTTNQVAYLMTEFYALHAQRIAEKMVSERISSIEALLDRAAGLVGNPGTNISVSCDVACCNWQRDYEEYLKNRDSHE